MSWEIMAIFASVVLTIVGLIRQVLKSRKARRTAEASKQNNNRKQVVEENYNIAVFIAELAVFISRAEHKTLCGRHFTLARAFYMENATRLGVEPKEFHGMFRVAKSHAQKLLELEGES